MNRRTGVLAGVVATLLAAAPANAFPVGAGRLDTTIANVYDTTAPTNTQRTWLGYTVRFAAGTAGPILPATGPSLNPLSATGDHTWSHPAATLGGEYDPVTRKGTLDFTGGMRFQSVAHGFNITIENPRVVLDGDNGQLFASGTQHAGEPYDRTSVVYDLDLSGATVTDGPGGVAIAGIVPRIGTENLVYPSSYAKGAGPERTPNTFGSFTLAVGTTALTVPQPGATPPPAATPTPTPTATATATATATPAPATPVVSKLALSRKRVRFAITRPVPTHVLILRSGRRVSSLRFTPRSTSVSLKVRLRRGSYRVVVTPDGGRPVSRRVRL